MSCYSCSVCGSDGVKLWRPIYSINPLVCSKCSEKVKAKCGKLIPAIPNSIGCFYPSIYVVPDFLIDWWNKLPDNE